MFLMIGCETQWDGPVFVCIFLELIGLLSLLMAQRENWASWVGGVLVLTSTLGWFFFLPGIRKVLEAGARAETEERFKAVALALRQYGERDGDHRLPPAAVLDKDGRPLLSWRVLILPHLRESDLYGEFRLTEPWDSPHNLKLLSRMPSIYAPSGEVRISHEPHTTFCQAILGPGTGFACAGGCRFPLDFPQGSSRTLLIGEASEPVPWTKPQDILVAPAEPFPEFGALAFQRSSIFFNIVNTFCVAYADGSVESLLYEENRSIFKGGPSGVNLDGRRGKR